MVFTPKEMIEPLCSNLSLYDSAGNSFKMCQWTALLKFLYFAFLLWVKAAYNSRSKTDKPQETLTYVELSSFLKSIC